MNRNGLFGGVPIGSYFNEPQVQKFDMGGHAHPHGGNPYAQYADSMQDAGLTNLSGTTRTNQTSRLANNEFYRDRYNDSLNPVDPISHDEFYRDRSNDSLNPVDPISHDDNSNFRAHTNEGVNSGSIFGNLDWDQVRENEREAIRKAEVLQEWVQRNAKPNIQSPYLRNVELAAANKKSSELFGDLEYDADIINTAQTDPYRRYDWDKTAPTGVRLDPQRSTNGSSPDNIFAKIGPRADRTKVFTGFSHEEKYPMAMYLPRDINLGGLYREFLGRGYDDFDLMLRGLEDIETNQILLDARLSKPPVAAHESIHGAFNKIEEMYEEDKDHFSEEYGESAAFMMRNLYSDGLLLGERMTEYFDNLDDSRFDMDYTQDTFISPKLKEIMRKVVSGEDFFWDEVPSKSEEDSFSLESYSGEKVVATKDWTPTQEVEGMVGLVKAAEDIYKEHYLSKNPDSNPLRPKVRPQIPSPLRPKARPDKIQFGLGEVQKFDMGGHAHPHGGVADRREARKALGNANLAAGKYDNIQALQDWVASNEDKPKVNNDALATILSGGASNVSPVSVPIYNPVMDDPYIVGDGEGDGLGTDAFGNTTYIGQQAPIEQQNLISNVSPVISDNFVIPPPSSQEVEANLGDNAKVLNPEEPNYSGDVDRYSIPVDKYIPPNLRSTAYSLGLTDLSNLNPFTSMFQRPRDAAARYSQPLKYSPTGKREASDLLEAGMGPVEALMGLGLGKYLREPLEQVFSGAFGLNFGDPSRPNVYKSSENLPLYHGTAVEFLPSMEVTLPDGEVKRLDDRMFDMISPVGMTNFRVGMDVSETPFAKTFKALGYPKGTKITRADPYGRFTTDMIGSGEGGFKPGSQLALEAQRGAMFGKGIYFGQRPNVGQSYRYSNTDLDYETPYTDSSSLGIGQKTIEEVQDILIRKYGDMETAREVFNQGIPGFGYISDDFQFNYKTDAQIDEEFLSNKMSLANDIINDSKIASFIPDFVNKVPDYYGPSYNLKLDAESTITNVRFHLKNKIDQFLLDADDAPYHYKREMYKSLAENLENKLKDIDSKIVDFENEKFADLQENRDLEKVMSYEPGDIPGNLYFSKMQTGNLGRSLSADEPTDLGTLNDMIDIFGIDHVEDKLKSTFGSMRQGQPYKLIKLNNDPRGFKYALPGHLSQKQYATDGVAEGDLNNAIGNMLSKLPTESAFKPTTVDEMNKLSAAGYSHLTFEDFASRGPKDDKTYNYVFFGDDIMPKIVDKKQLGGLVGRGLGSV